MAGDKEYRDRLAAELKAEIARLQTALEVIEGKRGGSVSNAGPSAPEQIPLNAFYGMGVLDAGRKYLGLVRQPQSTTEIADALVKGGITHKSSNFPATVNAILLRDGVKKGGGIIRYPNGTWGLPEWHPGAKLKRTRTAKGEETDEEAEGAEAETTEPAEPDAASSSAP